MKKQVLAVIFAALFVGTVNAAQTATATSGATTGSGSVTVNVQNGFAAQGTKTGASNTSSASAWRIGPLVGTSASTGGVSGSASLGVAYGAFGATGGFALQGGTAYGHSSF